MAHGHTLREDGWPHIQTFRFIALHTLNLRRRESIVGPSQWDSARGVKQGVLLLNAPPRLLRGHLFMLENLSRDVAFIGLNRLHRLRVERLAETQDVVTSAERVRHKLDRLQPDLRVTAVRLVRRGTCGKVDGQRGATSKINGAECKSESDNMSTSSK